MASAELAFAPVIESIVAERPLGEILDTVAATVADSAGFDFCAVLVVAPGRGRIRIGGSANLPENYRSQLDEVFDRPLDDLGFTTSPTVRALRAGEVVVLEDALADPSYENWRYLAERFGWRSLMSSPMHDGGQVVGVVNGYGIEPRTFTAAHLHTVQVLAQHATLALRLSVLVASRGATIAELRARNTELAEQSRVLEQAHRIHVTLNDAVLDGADEAVVARLVCDLVGRPIVVGGADGRAPIRVEPAGWVDPGSTRAHRPEEVRRDVRIGRQVVGHVIAEIAEAAADPLLIRAVEHAATVLAVHEARVRAERATEERLESDFVYDLVHGRDTAERLRERARHYGVDVTVAHRVLLVSLAAAGSTADRAPRTVGRTGQDTVRTAASVLNHRLPGARFSRMSDALTILVPTRQPAGGGDLPALHAALAEVRRSAAATRNGAVVTCGIGGVAEWEELPRSFRDATRTLQALVRLGRSGVDMAVDELGLLGLFLDSERAEEIVTFGRALLAPLLRDTSYSRQLLSTLNAYLDQGCRLGPTAAALFMHPNTLKYRLRQIEERCGVDLHEPYDITQVTLARLSLRLGSDGGEETGGPAR